MVAGVSGDGRAEHTAALPPPHQHHRRRPPSEGTRRRVERRSARGAVARRAAAVGSQEAAVGVDPRPCNTAQARRSGSSCTPASELPFAFRARYALDQRVRMGLSGGHTPRRADPEARLLKPEAAPSAATGAGCRLRPWRQAARVSRSLFFTPRACIRLVGDPQCARCASRSQRVVAAVGPRKDGARGRLRRVPTSRASVMVASLGAPASIAQVIPTPGRDDGD